MRQKILFMSHPRHLAAVRKKVRRFLLQSGFDECVAESMVLGLDEACTNIIRHAYVYECKPIRLEMSQQRDRVTFTIRDYGRACEPSKIQGRALEDIRPGGLGVNIIRQAFDKADYAPQPRGTRLTLWKKRPKRL